MRSRGSGPPFSTNSASWRRRVRQWLFGACVCFSQRAIVLASTPSCLANATLVMLRLARRDFAASQTAWSSALREAAAIQLLRGSLVQSLGSGFRCDLRQRPERHIDRADHAPQQICGNGPQRVHLERLPAFPARRSQHDREFLGVRQLTGLLPAWTVGGCREIFKRPVFMDRHSEWVNGVFVHSGAPFWFQRSTWNSYVTSEPIRTKITADA